MKLKCEERNDSPTMYYCWGEQGEFQGLEDQNVLVSAGVAWNNPNKENDFNAWIPDESFLMVDSGGFQCATKWEDCEYPYSAREYMEWCREIGADIVAGMDVACEERDVIMDMDNCSIDSGTVEERLMKSLQYQLRQYEIYKEEFMSDFFFMPVVQGNTVEQYEWFAKRLKETRLIQDRKFGGKVAIGSTCKRDDKDKILEILKTVKSVLPDDVKIHLFGATISIYKDKRFSGLFDSSDSASWKNYGAEGRWCKDKEEKAECLERYKEKVREYSREMENPDGHCQMVEFMDIPSAELVYDARWGNLEAMEKLGDMGYEEL